jgi:pimeloyl-ACP methyl ester carboxylesterase
MFDARLSGSIGARLCVPLAAQGRRRPTQTWLAVLVLVFISCGRSPAFAQAGGGPCSGAPRYGDNAAASGRAQVNGISLYYESYGKGQPLLVIHGNGGTMDRLRCQIAFFSQTRRVIAADSRAHGQSDNGPAPLKYEQIADDLAQLVRVLGIERVDVLGHSDGAIVALLMAIRHPAQVGKVVASSPNLSPDVISPSTLARVREQYQTATQKIADGDRSQDWLRVKLQKEMVLNEPHITAADLKQIGAPTLIMTSQHDVIPMTHFVEIASHIPRAQLSVLPAAGHMMHQSDSDLYNIIANRFLEVTFSRSETR